MKIKTKNKDHKKRQKTPKKITAQYLHNSGLYYLQRFAASSAHFEFIMTRKIKNSCRHHIDQDFEECISLLKDTITKFQDLGLLDDDQYTKTMVNSLRHQGKSKKAIIAKLRNKGLPDSLTSEHLQRFDEEQHSSEDDSELHAGLVFARKKRLGPFQRDKDTPPHDKALGSLARAGFSYDTAQKVLSFSKDEAERQLLESLESKPLP